MDLTGSIADVTIPLSVGTFGSFEGIGEDLGSTPGTPLA